MLLEADAVPGAVDELLTEAGGGDDVAGDGVDLLGTDAGTHRVTSGILGLEQDREVIDELAQAPPAT